MIKESQQFITSFMFDEDIGQEEVSKFRRKHLINSSRCQIFTNTLLQLHKNIVGELSDRLRLLYMQMGLHVHSKQKLYEGSWNTIANGINELAEMDMQQDVNLIRSFINHYHPTLRSVAQVALLRIQKETPFSFLDDLQEPILEWQQLQLASAAHKAHIAMPAFKRWVFKKEDSIVTFCIRMIALYNQHEAEDVLVELLNHPSEKVRAEAIKAIRTLETYGAKEKLVELYDNETVDIKIDILKTLSIIADDDMLPFYLQAMTSAEKRLRLAGAKAMSLSGALGREALQRLKSDLENELQPVAAYALDDRL